MCTTSTKNRLFTATCQHGLWGTLQPWTKWHEENIDLRHATTANRCMYWAEQPLCMRNSPEIMTWLTQPPEGSTWRKRVWRIVQVVTSGKRLPQTEHQSPISNCWSQIFFYFDIRLICNFVYSLKPVEAVEARSGVTCCRQSSLFPRPVMCKEYIQGYVQPLYNRLCPRIRFKILNPDAHSKVSDKAGW